MAKGAAHGEVLVPTQQLVDRHDEGAAPARVGRVHGTVLLDGAVILEDQLVAFLAKGEADAMGAPIAGATSFDVGSLAPDPVGQGLEFRQEGLLRIVDHFLHHRFYGPGPVTIDQREHPILGGDVPSQLCAEVESHHLGLSRRAQVEIFDVLSHRIVLDDFHGWDQDAFFESAFCRGAEAARGDAADVVLVQAVRHPAEELALVKDRTDQHHVLLMSRPDPRIVGEEHVAVLDAGVVAAVLEDPLHLGVGDAGHVLHVGAEIDELGVLGEDRGIEIQCIHGYGRTGDALDRGAVLFVDVPEVVTHHLVGDRIDVLGVIGVHRQARVDVELVRRHVALAHAVKHLTG